MEQKQNEPKNWRYFGNCASSGIAAGPLIAGWLPFGNSFASFAVSASHSVPPLNTMGRITKETTRRVHSHLLVRSLILLHHSLICLPHPAYFAHGLHSFIRSSVHSRPSSWERGFDHDKNVNFIQFQPIIQYPWRLPIPNGDVPNCGYINCLGSRIAIVPTSRFLS